jgi:hypothetical protein
LAVGREVLVGSAIASLVDTVAVGSVIASPAGAVLAGKESSGVTLQAVRQMSPMAPKVMIR